MLPEHILLEIFDFYRLDDIGPLWGRQWKWHHLVHICRKWWHVVTMSTRRLHLQIVCRSRGGPIESILDALPTVPLSVLYYDLESTSLSKKIIITFCRPDCVWKINFTLSSSLLIGSIVPMIQEPFPELEWIQIKVQDTTGPPLAF